jgi:hypothetical protein
VGKYPALIVKENYEIKAFFGEIDKIDSSGIWFNRTKEGFLYSKSRHYDYKNILCVINDRNEITYGSIPKKYHGTWDIEVEITPRVTPKKPMTLKLNANEEFSFCVEPSDYTVTYVLFKRGSSYTDYSINLPKMSFSIVPHAINYVGDIYLDTLIGDSVHKVECKIGSRPSDAAMGAMFGLIGAALTELSRSGNRLEHTLGVVRASKPENAVDALLQ